MEILNLVKKENSSLEYKLIKFPDGQQNINIQFTKEVLQVQIRSRLNNWLDLELIVCAVASLREAGVEEIHLYTPYILGSRSDRKFEKGGNNYLKDVICPILNSLNFKTITCMDPHSDVLEACLKNFKKVDNLGVLQFAQFNIYERMSKEELHSKYILISPDAGASKKIYKLAEQIGYNGDIITCSKDRDTNGKLTKCIVPLNDRESHDFIIIDDICDGGATFINIAKEIKEKYKGLEDISSIKIYLIVTHGIFSKGFEELHKYFDGIYTTNSYGDLWTDVYIGENTVDQWVGPTEEHYWSEIPLGFVKQLNIF